MPELLTPVWMSGHCTVEGKRGVVALPIFLIKRRFAEDVGASAEVTDRINRINEEAAQRRISWAADLVFRN
jgi:hypothetical protein